jgi:hypothetical protein
MEIYRARGIITTDNDKTNLVHKFDMPKGIKTLVIRYGYTPKYVEDRKKAVALIRECYEKYDEKIIGRASAQLPVSNLVTLSVDENGKYRGCAHRQNNSQTHILSKNFASEGFIKGEIEEGEWDIVLSVHCANCDIDYAILVEGEMEE